MEQACQWGWMELLGTGKGFKSGSCSHLLGVRLEAGWVVSPISRSAGKAGIEERLNRGRGGLSETEERWAEEDGGRGGEENVKEEEKRGLAILYWKKGTSVANLLILKSCHFHFLLKVIYIVILSLNVLQNMPPKQYGILPYHETNLRLSKIFYITFHCKKYLFCIKSGAFGKQFLKLFFLKYH